MLCILHYNKNKKNVPIDLPKARGRPEFMIPSSLQPVVRQYIRTQNLKGQHVSVELVREYLSSIKPEYKFPTTTLWRALTRWGFTYGTGKRRSALKERDYVMDQRGERKQVTSAIDSLETSLRTKREIRR